MVRCAEVIASHVSGLKRSPTSLTSRGFGLGDCADTTVAANRQARTNIERCIAPPIGIRLDLRSWPAILFDHARSDGIVVFVDDYEAAGLPINAVGVANYRL